MESSTHNDEIIALQHGLLRTCLACGFASTDQPDENSSSKASTLCKLHCGHRLCQSCKEEWDDCMNKIGQRAQLCPFCFHPCQPSLGSPGEEPMSRTFSSNETLVENRTKGDSLHQDKMDSQSKLASAYDAAERTLKDWLCPCDKYQIRIRCNDCKYFFCEECKILHEKFVLTRKHIVSEPAKESSSSSFGGDLAPGCFFHLDKPWEYVSFSPDGRVYELCGGCFRNEHSGWPKITREHFIKSNECASMMAKRRIQESISKADEYLRKMEEQMEYERDLHDQMQLNIEEEIKKCEQDIVRRESEEIEMIESYEKLLQERIELLNQIKNRDEMFLEMVSYLTDQPQVEVSPQGLMLLSKLIDESKVLHNLDDLPKIDLNSKDQRSAANLTATPY